MTHADADRFASLLAELGQAFPERPVSDGVAEVYFEALSHLEWPAVQGAVRRAIRECKFFPRVAELLERVADEDFPDATAAWADFRRVLARYRPGLEPPRAHPLVREAVQSLGGWRVVSNLSADVQFAAFTSRYEQVRLAALRRTAPPAAPMLVGPSWGIARDDDTAQAAGAAAARKRTHTGHVEPVGAVAARVLPTAPALTPQTMPVTRPVRPVETEEQRQQRVEAQRAKLRNQARALGVGSGGA